MKRIESLNNPRVKQWRKLHTKKERDKTKTFLVEGFHLVEEAIKTEEYVREVVISESVEIPASWVLDGLDVTIVTDEIMTAITATETTQGIAAVCGQHIAKSINPVNKKLLLIDAVQDPGNVGTLIRTADAAGLDAVIIGDGTVDIYNSKVIRSTQGAIFHLPIYRNNLHDMLTILKAADIPVYGTSLKNAIHYKEVDTSDSFALIVGNEGKGVSTSLLTETTKNLFIPIKGKSESLNVAVAAGILMFHLVE